MTMSTYLWLKADGEDLIGDSRQDNIAGVDVSQAIEVWNYTHTVNRPVEPGTSVSGGHGRREFQPITITIRYDHLFPRLFAASNGAQIDAVFKFFRPRRDPNNQRGYEHYLTISTFGGQIRSLNCNQPDTQTDRNAESAVTLAFTFDRIEWNYECVDRHGGNVSAMHVEDWTVRTAGA